MGCHAMFGFERDFNFDQADIEGVIACFGRA
jgi:hypothetical protein